MFASTCPACGGSGSSTADPIDAAPWSRPSPPAKGWPARTCVECGGSGEIAWKRCPSSQAGSFGASVLELARTMEAGFLPCSGGWTDQAACAVKALRLCSSERGRIEEKLARKEQELARIMEKGGG